MGATGAGVGRRVVGELVCGANVGKEDESGGAEGGNVAIGGLVGDNDCPTEGEGLDRAQFPDPHTPAIVTATDNSRTTTTEIAIQRFLES